MGKCRSWLYHLQDTFKQHAAVVSTICDENDSKSKTDAEQEAAQHEVSSN